MSDIRVVDSEALETNMKSLLANERRAQALFLLHLGEFERRRLYERHGYANMWQYCTEMLHLSESQSYYRLAAARVIARFAQAAAMLGDGRLCLTTLVQIQKALTEENADDLLLRVVGKSKDEVALIVAGLKPVEVRQETLIRRLPAAAAAAVPALPAVAATATTAKTTGDPVVIPRRGEPSTEAPAVPPPETRTRRPTEMQPISADEYLVRLVVKREFVDLLDKATSVLSHSIADGDPRAVLTRALQAIVDHAAKRTDPEALAIHRVAPPQDEDSAHISAALRREVWQRDEGCCCFMTATGRCGSIWQLEIDHIVPRAKGGKTVLSNLRLVCGAHNQMLARQAFGASFIESKIRRKADPADPTLASQSNGPPGPSETCA